MDQHPGSKRKAVGELLSQVLSRDAVEINACINSSFASNVAFSGHGLRFEGASNLKHASWLFNALVGGQPATFDLKDIEWDEKSNSATIYSTRYVRAKFFPFVGFAVPVYTHLRFNADGGEAGSSASQSKLYVTKFEDHWPTDQLVKALPIFGVLYTTLITPIATFIWLTLSNIAFAAFSRITSSKRQYVDPSVDVVSGRVEKALPKEVAKSVNTGFKKGTSLAEGWGDSLVHLLSRITYPILLPVESVAQRSVSAFPVPLPYPYIYDAHSHPPTHPGRKLTELKEKKVAATADSKSSNSAAATVAPKSASPSQPLTEEKKAAVQVLPAIDGSDPGKVVDVAHRNNNETKDTPAPALKPKTGESLYDQLRKDGQLPTAEDTERLTKMTQAQALAGASSEEEENGHGHASVTNGATKKKKSGSKKKKAGVSHPPPPSFKEGLHHAEEQEHQGHH